MFNLKNLYRQAILDGGEGGGDGGQEGGQEGGVLDDGGQEITGINVESVITNFEGDDVAKAQNYAKNYADERGFIDVAKMVKSGFNLESKFGSFTGAPDEYDMPTPEYLEGDIDKEDPYLQEFMALAKDSNMNQESFQKFMDIHLRASIAPPVDVEVMGKEIGPEFDAMRSNMGSYFKQRLEEGEFKALNSMITGPDQFKALYSLYKASKPTKMDDTIKESFNQAEMKDQMEAEFNAKDDNGNPKMRDPVYAESWRTRWKPFIDKSDI